MAPRVPAGVPTGGQFAASARGEASIHIADIREALPDWDISDYPAPFDGLDTRDGSFDACKIVSAAYTQHLLDHGFDAGWVQAASATPDYPEAHPKWGTVNPAHWQHYVTRVRHSDGSIVYVDWTIRQFDPTSPWPLIEDPNEFSARWGESYDIPSAALTDWNTRSGLGRYPRNTKHPAVAPRT